MTKQIYAEAVECWGVYAQFIQALEELAELSSAITHMLRDKGDLQNLAEEIADVEIMVEQLKYIMGEQLIEGIKESKLHALSIKIKEHQEQLAKLTTPTPMPPTLRKQFDGAVAWGQKFWKSM